MELIDYLNQHFFTRAQLLAAACITGERLDTLIREGVMPRASYRLRLALGCDSFFGAHAEEHAVEYYARGSAAWIGALQACPSDPFGMFARRYREALAELRRVVPVQRSPRVGEYRVRQFLVPAVPAQQARHGDLPLVHLPAVLPPADIAQEHLEDRFGP